MSVTADFIQSTIDQSECFGAHNIFEQFAIDSRHVAEGGTFIALPGNKQDGHDFIADAVKHGARSVIINQDKKTSLDALSKKQRDSLAVAIVPDTYTALYDLAAAWRQQFSYPIIGVTGSVGKTSTKELLASMLRNAGKQCFASYSNQNTQIGVALNILRLDDSYDVAIFEMGIDRRGEMEKRAALVQPTTGIITTVAHSHLSGIGSLHDIAAEKRKIFSQFRSDNIGIVNGDIPILSSISYPHPVIRFGFKTTNQIQARKLQITGNEARFTLKLYGRRYKVTMETGHTGYVLNALACAAACCFLGISDEDIVAGMQKTVYIPGRYCPHQLHNGKGVLIDDCYNANPASMKEAILAFERYETNGEKIAILGDMEDLGVNTSFWHRQLGRILRKAPSITKVILVGKYVHWTHETVPFGVDVTVVADWKEAYEHIHKQENSNVAMLVKASRSVGLDNLVQAVTHV